MKDEEMAEQFADNINGLDLTCSLLSAKDKSHSYRLGRYEGFLAGLKAGRPQLHDLREDPTDLPKEENRIMLCYCCNGYHGNIGIYVYRLYTKKEFHKVIAWCELPTFDKE